MVDRSGSMGGDPIEITREVLREAIDLLPKNSYFNIISFGSYFEYMFEES